MLVKTITILILLISAPCLADLRIDGNWWNGSNNRSEKANYIIGLYDGMELSSFPILFYAFSTPKYDKNRMECAQAINKATIDFNKEFFSNVKIGQIVDGIDLFYKDYKNRKISVMNALYVVLNGISGKSEENLKSMTENYRKQAANE